MKKIFGFFIAFMLVASVIALAEEEADDSRRDYAGKRLNEVSDDKRIELRKQEESKVLRQEKVREYKNLRDAYKDKKESLSQSRDKYKDCINSEGEECRSIVKETKLAAKDHLINSANLIIENLEQLKSRIQSSSDLTKEEIDEVINKIEEQIKKVSDAKSILENINEETSRDEIKEAASTIRQSWQEVKVHYHKIKLRHLGARLRTLILKAEILGERAEEKASGLNSEELNSLILEYNSNVESAKEQYDLGKKEWERMIVPGQVDEVTRESQKYLKEANNKLKGARRILMEITKMFREKKVQFSLESREVEA